MTKYCFILCGMLISRYVGNGCLFAQRVILATSVFQLF